MLVEGTEVGRYRVESLLGAGGMGQVYRAYDRVLRRRVALKILRPDLADAAARLLREARAAAAVGHAGTVALFDVGEANGLSFIAMELVDGKPLRTYVGDLTIPLAQRLRWLADVARVLALAHDRGFVHRDIKPENVMVEPDGTVKVLDFGIAKQTGEDDAPRSEHAGPVSFRTVEGRVSGTPRYMAPEQLRGDPLDGRTDQWSWGAMAYELLSGVHPRAEGDGPPEMLNHRVPEIPFAIAAAIMRTLAPTPELRFPSMIDVVAVLDDATKTLEAPATSATESTAPPSVGARRLVRIRDPRGTLRSRFLLPTLALAAVAIGFTLMLHSARRGVNLLGFVFLVLGLAYVVLAPLFGFRRSTRLAEVVYGEDEIAIVGAGLWNQTLARVTGASLASTEHGASIVLARDRRDLAVTLDFGERADAAAVLATLGIGDVPVGVVRWSLGRGPLEWLALALGVGWRLAWPLALGIVGAGDTRLGGLVIVIAIGTTVLALLARVALPRSGPFVALTATGLEVSASVVQGGSRRVIQRLVRREDVIRARPALDGLHLELRDGTALTILTRPVPLSQRGLDDGELAALAAHVETMASRERTQANESMLGQDVVTGRDGGERKDERATV